MALYEIIASHCIHEVIEPYFLAYVHLANWTYEGKLFEERIPLVQMATIDTAACYFSIFGCTRHRSRNFHEPCACKHKRGPETIMWLLPPGRFALFSIRR